MAKTRFTTNIVAKDSAKLNGSEEGGGTGGTTNYNELENKPRINGVELSGDKSTAELGINIPTFSPAGDFYYYALRYINQIGEKVIITDAYQNRRIEALSAPSAGTIGQVLALTANGIEWVTPSGGATPKRVLIEIGIMPSLSNVGTIPTNSVAKNISGDDYCFIKTNSNFEISDIGFLNSYIRVLDCETYDNIISERFVALSSNEKELLKNIITNSVLTVKSVPKNSFKIVDSNYDAILYNSILQSEQLDMVHGEMYTTGQRVYSKYNANDDLFEIYNPAFMSMIFDNNNNISINLPNYFAIQSSEYEEAQYDTRGVNSYDSTNYLTDSVFLLSLDGYYFGDEF